MTSAELKHQAELQEWAAFLYNYVPFLLLGFVFQFIARHLLYTPERYSGGKFRNFPPLLSHVCPAALSFDGYECYMPQQ